MDNTNEFLLRSMIENWIHARQSEDKRATIANVILVVASAIQGMLVLVGLDKKALPLTITLIILGIYGALTSAKLYERSQFHILRARKLRDRLDELCPEAQVQLLQKVAEDEHKTHYPVLMNVRLNTIWLGLHTVVAILGVVYTIICLAR
jgi:hypothetical protein